MKEEITLRQVRDANKRMSDSIKLMMREYYKDFGVLPTIEVHYTFSDFFEKLYNKKALVELKIIVKSEIE